MLARLRSISLSQWILISMVVGTLLGWANHEFWPDVALSGYLNPVSSIFLRMIKSIVVPLVFSALVDAERLAGTAAAGIATPRRSGNQTGRRPAPALLEPVVHSTVPLGDDALGEPHMIPV